MRSRLFPFSFYLAVLANLLFFASFQWTYVTLPGFVQSLGGGAAQIGLALGLLSLSAVAVRPSIGRLTDRWGRRPVLLLGAAVFALCPALYAATHSVPVFMAVRLLHGVGLASFTTAYTALVADLAPVARRGEAIGLAGAVSSVGLLFAPAAGELTQARWGYPLHFWAAAAIACASMVALLPVRDPKQEQSVPLPVRSMWAIARAPRIWGAALGGTGLAVGYGAALSFVAPFAAVRGLSTAGGYFTAFALAMMAAQAVAGWLSDRIGRQAVAVPGLVCTALASCGLALVHSNGTLLATGAGLGLGWGLVRAGLDSAVVDAAPPGGRATALSFLYTCFDLGVGIGAFGLGIAAQAHGYPAAFWLAGAWATIALAGYLIWGRQKLGP